MHSVWSATCSRHTGNRLVKYVVNSDLCKQVVVERSLAVEESIFDNDFVQDQINYYL